MKKIIKAFLLLLCFFMSCSFLSSILGRNMNKDSVDLDALSNKYIGKEGKRLGKKYGMSMCGIGGGIEDKIWLMSFAYQRFGSPLSEMEARKLIVAVVDDFLIELNNNKKMEPYLRDIPFTSKNVDIGIFNYTPTHHDYYHPYITI